MSVALSARQDHEIQFLRVLELNEILQCWQRARQALVSDHYGLTATSFLPYEYRRLVTHRYFKISGADRTLAVLRMIPNIDMRKYQGNLSREVIRSIEQGISFTDVGLYYADSVSRMRQAKITAEAILYSAQNSQGLYIQVPAEHCAFYEKKGFRVAGRSFLPAGWSKPYVPMYRLSL